MRPTGLIPGLVAAAAAVDYPTKFGVDLVFPRHNATYKRTSPFPVVLAIHGAPETWPPDLSFTLELMRDEEGPGPAATFETVSFNATDADVVPSGDEGTYFAVVGMMQAVNSTRENTFLRYGATFTNDCPEGEAADRIAEDFDIANANNRSSSIFFRLNDEKGVEPDVVPEKWVCPPLLQRFLAFVIEERVTDKCILFSYPGYDGDDEKCRVVPPEDFEENVVEKLEEIGKCANGTESGDGEGCNDRPFNLGGDEDEDESGEGGKGSSGSGSEDGDEEDEDSSAVSMRSGTLGAVGVLILPVLATFLW